jgi:hypothetical protein
VLERAVAFAVLVEIRGRGPPRLPPHRVHRLDRHQTIGAGIRERPQQQRIDDAEHDAVGSDADGERGDDDRGEAGIAPHQAQREAEILDDGFDDRQGALLLIRLGDLRDASERNQRLAPRLLGRHASAAIVVLVQLKIGVELFAQLAGAIRALHQCGGPSHPAEQRSHDCSPPARNRPRIADVRCHSRVSCSTRFRPARVSR